MADAQQRAITMAVFSQIYNLAFAFYHGILGAVTGSVWFFASCVYYALLSTMRLLAVASKGRKPRTVLTVTGALLAVLSLVLIGILYISLTRNTASQYGEIAMITIAAYTFTKITMAILDAVRQRRDPSPTLWAIRAIRYAQAAVSVLTMQQSMLVSFGSMDGGKALILNLFTGICVCLFTGYLGVFMIRKGKQYENR